MFPNRFFLRQNIWAETNSYSQKSDQRIPGGLLLNAFYETHFKCFPHSAYVDFVLGACISILYAGKIFIAIRSVNRQHFASHNEI